MGKAHIWWPPWKAKKMLSVWTEKTEGKKGMTLTCKVGAEEKSRNASVPIWTPQLPPCDLSAAKTGQEDRRPSFGVLSPS